VGFPVLYGNYFILAVLVAQNEVGVPFAYNRLQCVLREQREAMASYALVLEKIPRRRIDANILHWRILQRSS
jgi:ABC-type sulfate transport system permease component